MKELISKLISSHVDFMQEMAQHVNSNTINLWVYGERNEEEYKSLCDMLLTESMLKDGYNLIG